MSEAAEKLTDAIGPISTRKDRLRIVTEHLAATAELRRELEEAIRKREHTQQWYARRWARLQEWARKEIPDELSNQLFSILANGAKDVMEQPSTYDQQFNLLAGRSDVMTDRQLADTLAAALFALCEVLTEAPSRAGYIADGFRHGNAMDRARKALEEYRNNTPTTPCTPSSQDPN